MAGVQCYLNKVVCMHTCSIKWPYMQLYMRYYQYVIINTNSMNVDDEVEVGRILARTDLQLVPDSLTKALGAVGLPQYTLYAKRGWHPERIGEGSFQGSPPRLSRGYGC